MFDALPSSAGRPGPQHPGLPPPGAPVPPGVNPPPDGARTRPPIVLTTFGPRPRGPGYRGAAAFSLLIHVLGIGLAVWLTREVVAPRPQLTAVLLRKPPPPPPPPPPEPPEQPRQGRGRGVALPQRVHPEVQSDLEISFAASPEPDAPDGPTGAWLGGSGPPARDGWASGVDGTVLKRSLARDPQEVNSAWECDFPEGVAEGKVVVRIRIHVSAAGNPTRVTVVRPGPAPFNASAIECAKRQGFRPALDASGHPREGDRELSILFYRMGSGESVAPRGSGSLAPGGAPPDLPVRPAEDSPGPTSG